MVKKLNFTNTTMIINFLPILITGIFIGGTAGYLGSLMLSRKMTIVIDPLSHLALPGVALALIFNQDISIGAFLFLVTGTFLIWFLEQKTKLPTETIIAILFSTSLAITFLFLDEEKIHEALVGDISKIGIIEGLIIILISSFIFLILSKIYKKILLVSISEDLAKSEKIDFKKYQMIYLFLISAIVALGVKFVGGLLVAGLTALPAASARNLSRNLINYKKLAIFFGIISVVLGILVHEILNLPLGPTIIVLSFIIFIFSSLIQKNK